jgi:hypothetical protein
MGGSGLFGERGEKARRDDRHDRGLGVSRESRSEEG